MSKEGFAQHALASLIVGSEAPRENRPARPTVRGAALLAYLHELCFGRAALGTPTFWQELNLAGVDGLQGAWIDMAALWEDALLLVELKTDTKSTRPDQLSRYLTLGRAHFPDHATGLVLIAPLAVKVPAPTVDQTSYACSDWSNTMEAVAHEWAQAPTELEQAYITVLCECVLQP